MNPYQELDLASTATKEEVKQRYRELAKKYHPDRFKKKTDSERKAAEEKFKKIQEAYQVIVEGPKQDHRSQNFYEGQGQDFNFSSFEDIISSMFGFGGGFANQRRVVRLSIKVTNTLIEGNNILQLDLMGKKVTVTIPIGAYTGQMLQVPGMKDVYINLIVTNDKDFFRVGKELLFVTVVRDRTFKCLNKTVSLTSSSN